MLTMKSTAFLVLLLAASYVSANSNFPTEPAQDQTISCSGTVEGKYYDLSALQMSVTSTEAPYSVTSGSTTYFFNFCANAPATPGALGSGSCSTWTPVCQEDTGNQNWPCGSLSSSNGVSAGLLNYTGSSSSGGVDLFYPFGAQSNCNNIETVRNTTIRVNCDPSADSLTIVNVDEEPDGSCNYFIEVSSKYGCPTTPKSNGGGGGVAVGWIGFTFLILLVVGVILYLGLGAAWEYKRNDARGIDMIPNLEFWKDFPFLFWDGCVYFVRLVTCGKVCGGYSEI